MITPPPTTPEPLITTTATAETTTSPATESLATTTEATTLPATEPLATTTEATTLPATEPLATTTEATTLPASTAEPPTTEHPIGTFQNPASSCKNLPLDNPSGEYWILNNNTPIMLYCDMDRSYGNATGGWTRIAHLDMTDPTEQCPASLVRYGPLCERSGGAQGCVSTTFPANGTEYSHVCGRVIAAHWRGLQAFAQYYTNQNRSIDDLYVDGVSLTHGQSPRQHIWTFAAALNGETSDLRACPCTRNDTNFTGIVPPFIGNDYFCDTGRIDSSDTGNYAREKLWDGIGCGANSTCCSFNNPPWFCKQLPQPTTDDIELRQCVVGSWGSGGGEVSLSIVEIYVN